MDNINYCCRLQGLHTWILTFSKDIQGILYNAIEDTYRNYSISILDDYEDEDIHTVQVEISTCNWYEDKIDAELVIKFLQSQAYKKSDDNCTSDYLCFVNTKSLQDKLDKIWKEWKEEENICSPFFYADNNISTYNVNIRFNKENSAFNIVDYELV